MRRPWGALAIFALLNGVALFNALFHDPAVGYDAPGHLANIACLSRFEVPCDSAEFYSPPLPYFLPGMLLRSGLVGASGAAKAFQFQNLLCSLGLCLLLLRLAPPGRAFWTLALLALMPVYYRSFAMVRGEPMLAFFAVLSAFLLQANASSLKLGLSLGAMILCRQWGFLLFPAFALAGRRRWKELSIAFAVSLAAGGWFYGLLHIHYGSVAAFDRKMDLAGPPLSRHLELGLADLWAEPVRQYRFNRPLPALYADFWTDAFSYFLVYGRETATGAYLSGNELAKKIEELPLSTPVKGFESNAYSARGYFKAALAAALIPSAILAGGLLLNWRSFYSLAASSSLAGFLLWHLLYNAKEGDALKATYLLQACPFLALLGADFMSRLKERRVLLYRVVCVLVAASALHNLPLLVTRYPTFYGDRWRRALPESWERYRRLGRLDQAGVVSAASPPGSRSAEKIDALIQRHPQDARLLQDRGLLRFSGGDAAGAESDFTAAIARDQQYGDAYASLVSVQVSRRRFQEAGKTLETAEKKLSGGALDEFEARTAESRKWVREAVLGPQL